MRVLQAPDLHSFYSNYGRTLPSGEHSRQIEWRNSANSLVQTAINYKVDVVVEPGDLFLNSRPSPAQVLEVAEMNRQLVANGIEVVGIPGNHDLPGSGIGPVDLESALGYGIWTMTPQVVKLQNGLCIGTLPSIKPSELIAEISDPSETAAKISQQLIDIARMLRVQCDGKYNILIGHWSISGCITSSGQVMFGGTEPTLAVNDLVSMGWDAVLFGHIHKPQVLNEKPFIGYSGSLQRIDFGEANDSRGCWIHDLDAGTHEWIDLPARKFCTISYREDNLDELMADSIPLFVGIDDTIVRVKYTATEEQAKQINHSAIIKALAESGAHYVAGVFPEIIRTDRTRDANITESTKPTEALGMWLNTRPDYNDSLKQRVLGIAEGLLKEVS